MAQILFEDIFDVKALNENGKKFDRGEIEMILIVFPKSILTILTYLLLLCYVVDRFHCKGTTYDVDMVLGNIILHTLYINFNPM